jgi:hypothetical protein
MVSNRSLSGFYHQQLERLYSSLTLPSAFSALFLNKIIKLKSLINGVGHYVPSTLIIIMKPVAS